MDPSFSKDVPFAITSLRYGIILAFHPPSGKTTFVEGIQVFLISNRVAKSRG